MTVRVPWFGGRGNPPTSGSDLPGDYDGPEWIPPDTWSYSWAEGDAERLAAVRLAVRSAPGRTRTLLEKASSRLDRAYAWLAYERDRAIAAARRKLAAGAVPKRPKTLKAARDAERRAYRDLSTLIERYLPEL